MHGDDVNLAARLEALNKEHGTRIIVSERTRELAGSPDRFAFEALGTVTVRGRSRPVTIYRIDVQGEPSWRTASGGPREIAVGGISRIQHILALYTRSGGTDIAPGAGDQ